MTYEVHCIKRKYESPISVFIWGEDDLTVRPKDIFIYNLKCSYFNYKSLRR